MSLLEGNDLINIKLYYIFKVSKGDKRLIILSEEKGKKMFEEQTEETSEKVEIIDTQWGNLTWKEQNDVVAISSRDIDQKTGDRQFNMIIYRDAVVKKCLKEWNLTIQGNTVPVSPENIDRLPGNIVSSLYAEFEKVITYTEDELGN